MGRTIWKPLEVLVIGSWAVLLMTVLLLFSAPHQAIRILSPGVVYAIFAVALLAPAASSVGRLYSRGMKRQR